MNRDELRTMLRQPYNRQNWQGILREVFRKVSILATPHSIPCDRNDVESFMQIGSVQLDDGKHLSVFEVKVGEGIKLLRNRVELRNLVASHIDQQTRHGVLVIFDGQTEEYRFTFAARETAFDEQGNFVEKETATKRFTYLLGPNEACTTPALRFTQLAGKDEAKLGDVIEAFSVERLNKEFFDSYKRHYENFVGHLLAGDIPRKVFGVIPTGDTKEQDKANKPVRDFAKRLLGRIVFLYFLQKKGWLGCPANSKEWKKGEPDFIGKLFADCRDKDKFHSQCLAPLFYETLNLPNRPNDIFTVTGTRVPYLNGGLFEREPYPIEKIDFPATLFACLLEFFGQYNFTIDENDPDDNEVGIDPEMLGHIFENLLEDNKDKGAYYTPKPIVQYMCQQSLLYYLQGKLGEREELTRLVRHKDAGSRDDKANWVRQNAKQIEELLDQVKVCDPAIGSGAFPIGLLQEVYWLKLILDWTLDPAETKLKIIENSIYGVDIDAGAVEIARLRFWLALIVDEEQPRPLPNLDYKIMQGDSLLESFEGIPLDNLHEPKHHSVTVFSARQTKLFGGKPQPGQGNLFAGASTQEIATAKKKAAEITALTRKYFNETDPAKKQELHRKIDRFVLDHIDYNLRLAEEKLEIELHQHRTEIADKQKLLKSWRPPKKTEKRIAFLEAEIKAIRHKKNKLAALEEKPERPYFLWHLFFQDAFARDGFDIVIANPPYVRQETIKDYKPLLEPHYQCYSGTADLFVYFYERSVNLLKKGGVLTFISSNKYYRSAYGEKLRAFLADHLAVRRMIDFGDAPVFEAIAYASILLGAKTEPAAGHTLQGYTWQAGDSLERITEVMAKSAFTIRQEDLKPDGWRLESPEALALLAKLRAKGKPLGEYVEGRFYYGIKTGLNEAFVVDRSTRDRLIAEDPRSAEVLKPFLRGKDVKRWKADPKDLWLIFTRRGIDIAVYPAIHNHLKAFKPRLMPGTEGGRKPGSYEWFELQDNIAYWREFEKPKLVIPAIERECAFACDSQGYFSNDKTSICVSDEAPYLAAILNSTVIWWVMTQTAASRQNGYFEFKPMYLTPLPIPACPDSTKAQLSELAEKASRLAGAELTEVEQQIDSIVFALFELTPSETAIIQQSLAEQAASDGLDNKSALFSRLLPMLKAQSAYFSLAAVKRALAGAEIELADDTLREYMSEAMATGLVGDAGRGWYSRHLASVALDPKPVAKLIRSLAKAFPLLDFCCWSTSQLNPFAQHLIAQPIAFLYAESDALEAVAEHLRAKGWEAWANPGKKEAAQFVRAGERAVVLRPAIAKQPPSQNHLASIEKVLVDLKVEAEKLKLMDTAEVQRITDNILASELLQLPVLFKYAEVKSEKIESEEITH